MLSVVGEVTNYQWVAKDRGAFAHNGKYIMQVLYDSIQSVKGSTSGMTRLGA